MLAQVRCRVGFPVPDQSDAKRVMNDPKQQAVNRQSGPGKSAAEDRISSRKLLGNRRHLTIEHNGESYQLRITSNNKLILTK